MSRSILFGGLVIALILGACTPGTPTPLAGPEKITPLAIPNLTTPTDAPRCNTIAVEPTPGPEVPSLFPRVSELDHITGPDDAPVTIIVYTDFQCPVCDEYAALFKRLRSENSRDLRLVYRLFPQLVSYENSGLAAQAAEAANLQGKFWELTDLLYEQQDEWSSLENDAFESWLLNEAAALGMDTNQFSSDLTSDPVLDKMLADYEFGRKNSLVVPLILINGQIINPPFNFFTLDQTVRLIALGKRQFKNCPDWVINPAKQYLATLHTDKGDVVIQLFADKVPNAINSFVYLSRQGWYNDITFHRVISNYVVQTGDPSGTGMGNPGYFIDSETASGLKFDRPGMVGLNNSGADTNGSQFFITLAPTPNLDGGYTIIGQVISGLDVLSQLSPRDPQFGEDVPSGDKLISIVIEEK